MKFAALLILPGLSLTTLVMVAVAANGTLPDWLVNCSLVALPMLLTLPIGVVIVAVRRR